MSDYFSAATCLSSAETELGSWSSSRQDDTCAANCAGSASDAAPPLVCFDEQLLLCPDSACKTSRASANPSACCLAAPISGRAHCPRPLVSQCTSWLAWKRHPPLYLCCSIATHSAVACGAVVRLLRRDAIEFLISVALVRAWRIWCASPPSPLVGHVCADGNWTSPHYVRHLMLRA